MSRFHYGFVLATEQNWNDNYPTVPTSGTWALAYGKDHTAIGYFIDFIPLDDEAKSQCSISWDGSYDEEDPTAKAPESEWEYNPISLDQLFGRPPLNAQSWVDILHSFGVEVLL